MKGEMISTTYNGYPSHDFWDENAKKQQITATNFAQLRTANGG